MLHVVVPVHEYVGFLVTLHKTKAIDNGRVVEGVGENGDLLMFGRPSASRGLRGDAPQSGEEGGVGTKTGGGDDTGLLLGHLCQGAFQQAMVVGVAADHGRCSRTHPIHQGRLDMEAWIMASWVRCFI